MIMTMKTRLILNIFLLMIIIKTCSSDDTVNVKLKQGVLSGKVEKTFFENQDYNAFKGVPFAEAPIGDLRFKPPVPHQSWDGVYEAYDNKPTCFQYNGRGRNDEPLGMSGSEDCLYLNVYSPRLDGSLPVVVFDYNDNFRTGFNGSDTYSPDFFLEENVIVVTINHRLGVFGYLTTEDDVLPANAGLKDFILGLHWIRDNIEQFGGDPKSVTLMGYRGGAILVNLLLYSEKAKNLFNAAILQSGTAWETFFFEPNPREKAFKLGEAFEIVTNDSVTLLKELQKVSAEELINNEGFVIENLIENQRSIYPFTPVIEKKHLNSIIIDLPEDGSFKSDVPILLGMTSREGIDMVTHYIAEPKIIEQLAQDFLFIFPIRQDYHFDRNSSIYNKAIYDIQKFYLNGAVFSWRNILQYSVYVGDMLQSYALDYAAKRMGKTMKSDIYYYIFDFRSLLNENSQKITKHARFSIKNQGATVTDDLCYLHLCSRIRQTYEYIKNLVSPQKEMKVLKRMVRMWTNFIKTRNPTPSDDDLLNNFQWLPMEKDKEQIRYLQIDKDLRMKFNPMKKRVKFWDEFLAKYSAMAVDGVVQEEEVVRDEL